MATKDEEKKDPSTKSLAWKAMYRRWAKSNALLSGTDGMRELGEAYLPKHENEDDTTYASRLMQTTLFNGYELVLNSMVGRPFRSPLIINDDVPTEISNLFLNIDLAGTDLTVFARNTFRIGLSKAMAHLIVEFPRVDNRPRTLFDQKQEKLRPYWILVEPEDVIFANKVNVRGEEILTHVRIAEHLVLMDGFAEKIIPRIRVYDLLEEDGVQMTIYEKRKVPPSNRESWVIVEQVIIDFPIIPMLTFYADRQDFMMGKPPLEELADLNIRHWQSTSDQSHVLQVARYPILAASGIPDVGGDVSIDPSLQSDADKLTIGPNRILTTTDPLSKFYYVEHTGAAIEAGRKEIEDIEGRMARSGSELLRKQPGNVSATERALSSSEMTSPLQDIVLRFNTFLNRALQMTADWINIKSGGTVRIDTEFLDRELSSTGLNVLIQSRRDRDISREAYLDELKRLDILDEKYDAASDLVVIMAEKPVPSLQMLNTPPKDMNGIPPGPGEQAEIGKS